MSQKKISELTEVQSVNEDLCSVPVDNGSETVRITLKNLEASATTSAKAYSEQAAASATSSQHAADAAANSSNNASTYASNASDSAAEAASSAANASGFADAAGASASNANSSASQAANTATAVAQQVTNASNSAKLAESFAHGGTGARAGEDTDNAEYWARQAAAMHDGVASFNGRHGIVAPEDADYSANQIIFDNSDEDLEITSKRVQGAISEVNTKVQNNASQIQTLETAISNTVLYFSGQACSALTGDFCTISNANITANHVVAEAVFANPSAITTDVTWTTASGSLKLNGTCASATTVNIVLVKKTN